MNNGWINVKDQMPEKTVDVLVYNIDEDEILIAYWTDDEIMGWVFPRLGYRIMSVDYWAFILEPPIIKAMS